MSLISIHAVIILVSSILVSANWSTISTPKLPNMLLRIIPQNIADKFGAKCLDGSPPSMYVRQNKSSTEWIIFLEGGGWCFGSTPASTIHSCAGRARGGGGSSTHNPPTAPDYGGLMSADPAINPDFFTFNMAFFKYCDGSSFGGGNPLPVPVSGINNMKINQIWFRGRANFNALIYDLQTSQGMENSTVSTVILSGGSAGGLAVFYNLDHLATLLPDHVRLIGFPDAGFFLDAKDTSGQYSYRNNFIGADPVWNVTGSGGTNQACLTSNPGNISWKCLMAPHIAEYIKTPLFVMNSAYDGYQVPNILRVGCLSHNTWDGCSTTEKVQIQDFRGQMLQAIKMVTSKSHNGAYIDSCWVHEQNVNYCSGQRSPNCVGWSPLSSGSKKWGYTTSVNISAGESFTPQQAFSKYFKNDSSNISFVDKLEFPHNPSCIWKGIQ